MKKVRCKFCEKKSDMERLEGDWKYHFYKCSHCDRENPKRTFLGQTTRVGKAVVKAPLYLLLLLGNSGE